LKKNAPGEEELKSRQELINKLKDSHAEKLIQMLKKIKRKDESRDHSKKNQKLKKD
jgi:hypothetical protein